MKKLKGLLIIFLTLSVFLSIYIIYDNSRITVTEHVYSSDKIGKGFDGYRICVITDFHNKPSYKKVIDAVSKTDCDIICIAGDLVDMNTTDFTNARELMTGLSSIAPLFYTYGNHELWSTTENGTELPIVDTKLEGIPITYLNNRVQTIEKDGELLNLIGYGDNIYNDFDGNYEKTAVSWLKKLHKTLDKSVPSILLCHRPQYFSQLSTLGYDVIVSGHLHGGLINLPFVKSYILKSHFKSLEYDKGRYEKNGCTMFISGGVSGKGIIPRIFNSPEITVLELESK